MTILTHRYTLMCLSQSCSKLYISEENILMFRSNLGKIVISSRVSKKQLLPFCFGVLAFLVLLSSTGSGAYRANQAAHRAFSNIDSWNNIRPFLMFDYNISNPAAVAPRY